MSSAWTSRYGKKIPSRSKFSGRKFVGSSSSNETLFHQFRRAKAAATIQSYFKRRRLDRFRPYGAALTRRRPRPRRRSIRSYITKFKR